MKSGAENRNKTIIAIVLGGVLLCAVSYVLYSELSGPSDSAPPAQPATRATKAEQDIATATAVNAKAAQTGGAAGLGAIPGVDAQKLANASSSLDPTLDESAMLRTENLVYSGSGRNIFSQVSVALPMPAIPKDIPSARKQPVVPPQLPQAPLTCPPSCPPINLKFFGTATRGNVRQAFLLQGDDVYLASEGDIVAHKYKIVSIAPNSLQVQDLSNGNTQLLPLQQ